MFLAEIFGRGRNRWPSREGWRRCLGGDLRRVSIVGCLVPAGAVPARPQAPMGSEEEARRWRRRPRTGS